MKRLLLALLTPFSLYSHAQLLSWTPSFPKESDAAQTLVITMDATKGNHDLLNYSSTTDVYVHTGVITNFSTTPTDWRHVKFNQNFNQPNAALQATYSGTNKWSFTISGSLAAYYGLDPGETIKKVAILFRNGNGTKVQRNADGSDMYLPVYPAALAVRIDLPASQPKYTPIAEPQSWVVGTNFTVTANASAASMLRLYHNNTVIATASNATVISGNSTVSTIGNQQLVAEANDGTTIKYDTLNVFVSPPSSPVADLPAGVRDGINYEPGDTSVTLVLRAPGKTVATVIGEFNNWTQSTNYLMNKSPDGKFFWLRLHPLVAGTEYAYQYMVDNTIKIADPYAQKILDPGADGLISAATYPNLKPYPAGQSGIVSVLQTAAPTYSFTATNFVRPDKRGLVVYELLVRDFVAAHNWKTVQDSLNYLKKLGINAIEIMPFNEFEGNESWGYNPDFYFAPDKYYGPANTLKQFIDSCHKKGIAVIMDIALNHSFGQSPMVQLYFDAANNRPAADNPWFNPVATHPFNVGYDMNHESLDTRYFTSRVVEHWLTNYKIDGFRFDLSKGFTQKNTGNDVAAWSAYDASRIAIWKRYYDTLQTKSAGSYVILEHFADNTEEKELSDYGMMLWGNMNYNFQAATISDLPNSNFEGGIASVRGWTKPYLVSYAESHDEERLVYRALTSGNSAGSYNIKDTATALKRLELDAAFLFTIPGPKMLWQFGELGYDYSINYCTNGTVNNNCRLDKKPIRWDYLNDARRKSIYNTYSQLFALRSNPYFKEAFMSGTVDRSLGGAFKWLKVSTDTSNVMVIGNFDVSVTSGAVTFQSAGSWYDYLNNNAPFYPTGASQTINLSPGEFHVYINRNLTTGVITAVPNLPVNGAILEATVFPNPVKNSYRVNVSVPQTGLTVFELLTSNGQFIGQVYRGFLTKGLHGVTLNRIGVAGGTYYLRITNKTNIKIIPLIFQ